MQKAEESYGEGVVMKKCPFCKASFNDNASSEGLIHFHEHYYFCTDCSVIFTDLIVQKSDCEHIKKGVLTVIREPWYKSVRKGTYIIQKDSGGQECSVCGAACLADGW